MEFSDLIGKTLIDIQSSQDQIVFVVSENESYKLYHCQDCCENVLVDDIVGDLKDLIGSPITMAEESSNNENPKSDYGYPDESHTWTFYKLATIKGYVDIKWYGSSNGYYSEGVSFVKIGSNEDY